MGQDTGLIILILALILGLFGMFIFLDHATHNLQALRAANLLPDTLPLGWARPMRATDGWTRLRSVALAEGLRAKALSCTALGIVTAATAYWMYMEAGATMPAEPLLVAGVGGIAVILLGIAIYLLQKIRQLGTVVLEVETWPVTPGTSIGLRIRVTRPLPNAERVELTLQQREKVHIHDHRSGTWHTIPLSTEILGPPIRLAAGEVGTLWQGTIALPAEASHSFETSRYRLQWGIEMVRTGLSLPEQEFWLLYVQRGRSEK